MSKYKMNITGKIGLGDYSSINDYVSIVNKNDNLIITIDENGCDDVNIICSILEKNNFTIDFNEIINDSKCCINALKK